ncbi:MAG: 16S rRNA (guanine(966)-N(2))-methyltransferase RsmD [Acidobacteria bacterium]|nr:16S rRNA (guanine(966)-N(2))-methyltransferase RsmD [Acidobacteriota bacterium]
MRIIAGEFRSRKIESVPGMDVRPTPDRLRESLFSILQPILDGAAFVDAYAGCGSVGLEAISRGARRVTFIEKSSAALDVVRRNIAALRVTARASVVRGSAPQALETIAADIVFLDPPYTQPGEYDAALAKAHAPLVIAQHSSTHALANSYGPLTRYRIVKQGDNSLSFYRR